MSGQNKETRILIIDPDEAYGQRLNGELYAAGGTPTLTTPKPVLGSSLRECQKFLSNRDYEYSGVFINPALGFPQWVACVKSALQYRPGIPLYAICSEPPKTPPEILKQVPVLGFPNLPLSYSQLLKIIQGEIEVPTKFGGQPKPKTEIKKTQPTGIALNDSDLLAVDLEGRIGCRTSLFDLYIKLSSGKYIHILKAQDKLTQDRLDRYRDHGAESLYIPKAQHSDYIQFCDQVAADCLKDPNRSVTDKAAEIARYGGELLEDLAATGFSPQTVERAEKYVSHVTEAITQIVPKSPYVNEWISNVSTLEHSVGVTTVAGILLKHIGVIKPETYQAVGIGYFFMILDS